MVVAADQETAGTSARILDIAERLVQVRGLQRVQLRRCGRRAADHHRRPALPLRRQAPARLALVDRYAVGSTGAGATSMPAAPGRAAGCAATSGCTAPCCPTAACACAGCWPPSTRTLPGGMRDSVLGSSIENETWLEDVLTQAPPTTACASTVRGEAARLVLASLEGAHAGRPVRGHGSLHAAATHPLARADRSRPGRLSASLALGRTRPATAAGLLRHSAEITSARVRLVLGSPGQRASLMADLSCCRRRPSSTATTC